MRQLTGTLLAVFMLASVASAQEIVIQPTSTTLAANNDSFLEYEPRWIDGSGFTDGLESTIETGDPVPTEWPQHITGYNLTRTERIRNADEFETLTFDLGGAYELTGMVLWNSTESGQTERGFENTVLSYSTDGGATFAAGETLTWLERTAEATGNLGNDPVDPTTFAPEVQALAASVPGVTHVRMVVDNFSASGANVIMLASELRFTGLPAPEAYYVSATPTDWTDSAAWSDSNPATAGTQYFATNSVVLETPATTATFPGTFLVMRAPQRMEILASGADVITIDNLTLDAADLAAGIVDAGEAQIDGLINVSSNSMFSGATDNSRDLRILSQVTGGGAASVELSAPSHTIYIDNANNTFAGTWVVSDGATEFAGAGAVGSANISVSNGTLTILGDWDGLATDDSLTVADSATVTVDLGTYAWTVDSLQVGSSNVLTGFTYDAAALNAIGSAVFTGTGSIQVGAPFVPPLPPQLLHHWKFDDAAGTTATDSAGSSDGVIANGVWSSDGTRASFLTFNGTDSSVNPSVTNATPTAENGETWACWVLTAAGNNNDIIIGNRGDTPADFGKIAPRPAGGGRFAYRQDGALVSYDFNTGNATIVQDTWQHVAFVRDGSNATFYVDGVLVNDTPFGLPIDNASALPFFMGGEPGLSASEHFAGGIDDVVIYNYALTASNVVDVMNGIYDFGTVDLSSVITDYSFNPSGTSSLSFTGGVNSAYVIKSANSLTIGGFSTVTPSAVTTGTLAGDVITTDATGTAAAEFTETAPAKFYKVESAP